jgi:RNA polymerase sigma-70 factor (ECF subfamily)
MRNSKLDCEPQGDVVGQWIVQAREGDVEAWGALAERCRGYLLLVANRELQPGLKVKVGASDLVQDTLLQAQQALTRFEGQSEAELLAWTRQILKNKLLQHARRYQAGTGRDLARERSLANDLQGVEGERLVDRGVTPRAWAILDEETRELFTAIARLPEHYRQVIQLRRFEELTFPQIAAAMDSTEEAVRRLYARAIDRLRRELTTIDDKSSPPDRA